MHISTALEVFMNLGSSTWARSCFLFMPGVDNTSDKVTKCAALTSIDLIFLQNKMIKNGVQGV